MHLESGLMFFAIAQDTLLAANILTALTAGYPPGQQTAQFRLKSASAT